MKTVQIVVTSADPTDTRAWGEIKALDEPGMPTIGHVEARATYNDAFQARAGRHVFQFRVDRPAKITIVCKADGATIGPAAAFDCTTVTAGRRYVFEVPA